MKYSSMKNYYIGKKVQMRGSLENRDVWVCITLISVPLYYYKRGLLLFWKRDWVTSFPSRLILSWQLWECKEIIFKVFLLLLVGLCSARMSVWDFMLPHHCKLDLNYKIANKEKHSLLHSTVAHSNKRCVFELLLLQFLHHDMISFLNPKNVKLQIPGARSQSWLHVSCEKSVRWNHQFSSMCISSGSAITSTAIPF